MHEWIRDLATRRFPKGVRSQGGQDWILAEIFRHVPTVNAPPFCVEFGFDAATLDGGTGANVAALVLDHGWQALLLDRSHENPAINLRREFLHAGNIVAVFAKWAVPTQPDYISIDVDSTDLWLFRALLPHYRAAVYSVEYNCHFPLELSVTRGDDADACWRGDRGYGASLTALAAVAREHGYSLVAVEPMLDAFFIRDDLLDDGSLERAPPLETWRFATDLRIHAPVQRRRHVGSWLDYDVWRASGGTVSAARRAARAACLPYLCEPAQPPWLTRTWRHIMGRKGH
jgi:hypothetical protein